VLDIIYTSAVNRHCAKIAIHRSGVACFFSYTLLHKSKKLATEYFGPQSG